MLCGCSIEAIDQSRKLTRMASHVIQLFLHFFSFSLCICFNSCFMLLAAYEKERVKDSAILTMSAYMWSRSLYLLEGLWSRTFRFEKARARSISG